jgi:hypothetical protein
LRIADCGLRIADCGIGNNPHSAVIRNPNSAFRNIRNPQSAMALRLPLS